MVTGCLTAYALTAALLQRQSTGRGQRIDLSLLDAQVAALANQAGSYLLSGRVPKRYTTRDARAGPGGGRSFSRDNLHPGQCHGDLEAQAGGMASAWRPRYVAAVLEYVPIHQAKLARAPLAHLAGVRHNDNGVTVAMQFVQEAQYLPPGHRIQ